MGIILFSHIRTNTVVLWSLSWPQTDKLHVLIIYSILQSARCVNMLILGWLSLFLSFTLHSCLFFLASVMVDV
jgi:hypothetical protein